MRAGKTKTWEPFEVPDEGIGCGFTEAVRGVLSHHMVIEGGKIANYHPYPPTPWNANPRDSFGTPGPYEDAVMNTPIFEENDLEHFKGIDIMRAVRSFDPCLPCGVHMYLGKGKTLEEAALADPGRRPTRWPADQHEPGGAHGTAEPPGGRRPDRAAARRTARRRRSARAARWPRSCCGSVTELYGGGLERIVALASRGRARARATVSSTTSWSRACCSCTACTPTSVDGPGRAARSSRCGRSSPTHDGDVELLDIDVDAGAVHLRLLGSCDGCPSSAVTLRSRSSAAIIEAAPEIAIIDVEQPAPAPPTRR